MAIPWLLIAVMGLAATEVCCQFPPDFGSPPPLPVAGVRLYQGLEERSLPNFTMVAARDFFDIDTSIPDINDGINDGLWCQSTNNASEIGSWQFPDGNVVSTIDQDNIPLHTAHAPGQVGLLRDAGIGNFQGMYTCTIPDENGVNQTLVVWASGNVPYDEITEQSVNFPLSFNLPMQSRDTDPPVFTLSFDVSLVPPTYVTCQINNTILEVADLCREVIVGVYDSMSVPLTRVNVTLRTRQAGEYQCTVAVFRASGSSLANATSDSVFVTVTDTPLDFTATRTGLQTAHTAWSAPASSTPTVEGYEVFYEIDSGVRTSGANITHPQLNFTLSSLEPDFNYTAFVVAFGGDLPSAHSNTADIPAVVSIVFTTNGSNVAGSAFNITATITIDELIDVQTINITWLDSSGIVQINLIETAGSGMSELNPSGPVVHTLDLVFVNLQLSEVDSYKLMATITETSTNTVILERTYPVMTQIPSPGVFVTSPGSSLEGGSITLTGTITLPASVDMDTDINATWVDQNGVVMTSSTTVISTSHMNLNTYVSTLTISSLSVENNGSMYSLIVTVYPMPSDTSHLILPSTTTSSNEVIVEVAGLALNVTSSGSRVAGSTNFTATCTLSVTISLSTITLSLVDFNDQTLASTTNLTQAMNDGIVFMPSILNTSNAGQYMCVVMAQDSAGNNGSDSKTLNLIVKIGSLNVAITDTTVGTVPGRYFVSTPLTLTCSVNVSEAVDITNFTVIEAWTSPMRPIISDDESDRYIIAGAKKVGNSSMYISTLNITSLKILEPSDSGNYSCNLSLMLTGYYPNIQPQTISGVGQFGLTVEEVPALELTTATTDLALIGNKFSLICIVTTDEVLIPQLVVNWYTNGSIVMNSTNRTILTLTGTSSKTVNLTFDPAVMADQGDYICNSSLTIPGSNQQPETVSEMTSVGIIGAPQLQIMAIGSGVAGKQYSLQCDVTVGAGSPNVMWVHNGVKVTNGVTSSVSGATTTLTLGFNPLNYSHVGEYTCVGIVAIPSMNFTFATNESVAIEVQIPNPELSVETNSSDLLYQGTQQSLFCNAAFLDLPPDGIDVVFQWSMEGRPVTNDTRVTITNPFIMLTASFTLTSSTLTFSPINTTDSGNYTCTVTVTPFGNLTNITSPDDQQRSVGINVTELPVPDVVITSVGDSTAGNNFTLTCELHILIDNLVGMPVLEWVNTTISSTSENTLDYIFNPLRTSDGNVVVCQWTLSTLGLDFYSQSSFNLTVNIPTFAVSVHPNPSDDTFYEYTYIDLICDITISKAVDIGVDISFTWTGPGDMSIVSGVEGYNVTNQSDSSILRIEQLAISRDNMEVYSCSVSVTPSSGSVYVVGSESNIGDLTLNVIEITPDEFIVDISIPGSPTAGDNFTITCNVTGPERLVPVPTLFWEEEKNGNPPALVTMDEAIIGNVVVIGNGAFSITLGYTSIKTSHAHRYFCESFLSLSSKSVTKTMSEDLYVQISPPVVTVAVNPAIDPIYTSTALNLTCTAVLAEEVDTATMAMVRWIGPNNDQQPTDPNRISMVPTLSVEERLFESILMLYPVDFEVDNGLHTCQMTIQSNTGFSLEDGLIVTNSNSGNITIVAEELPPEVPTTNITSSTPAEVGQLFNLSCSVTLVQRMVVTPGVDYNITWMKMDEVSEGVIGKDININTVTAVGDPTTTVTLTFDPLSFEDRGTYICMAEFNITSTQDAGDGADEHNITVDFPPVAVEVSRDYGDPVYAGTNLTLTCFTDLDESLVDIPVFLNSSWTRNNIPITTDSTHIEEQPSLLNPSLLTYAATYSLTPLDNNFNIMESSEFGDNNMDSSGMGDNIIDSSDMGDSGTYQCDVTVTANVNDSFVRSRTGSNTSDSIIVLSLPDPNVSIIMNGTNTVGEALSLTCVVGVVDRLVVQPVIVWEKYASNESVSANTISVNQSHDGNNSTLSFSSLNSSDAGLYTCKATVTIESINVTVTAEDTQNITLQIPAPLLTLTQSRNGENQLAGSNLVFTTEISVNSNVDTPHTVSVSWTRDETTLSNGGRIIVSDVFDANGFNLYQAQLNFSTLSSILDNGMYASSINVISSSSYPFVTNALPSTTGVSITVNDPNITEFTEEVEDFVGVETGCIHSDLFDDVTLICTGSKPPEVIPPLTVTWFHNGTIHPRNNQSMDGTTVTNTLRFNSSVSSDSGNYTCTAEIIIPESTDVSQSTSIEVTFRNSRPPFTPDQVQSNVTTTTANISWTVPAIAYTPENYTVVYHGLELQPGCNQSELVVGDPTDILATDRVYSILLEDLEEANTYNYTVHAINCNGTTITDVMQFTTDPDFPSGEPQSCINNTYNARNIALQWEEPIQALQNGQIKGYKLTCYSDDPWADLTADLNATQSSTSTTFTIDPVSPFTDYTCSLSAINEVGEGPSTECTFSTQQDAPDDPPQDLASMRNINNVTFSWLPPSIPNGIIQRYIFSIYTDGNTTNETLCADQNTTTIDGFNPYQFYSVNVTASTSVNGVFADSPPAMLMEFTLPDRPSPVRDLSVESIDTMTFRINFTTPSAPNGIIDHYTIDVNNTLNRPANFTFMVTHDDAINQYVTSTAEHFELVMCVPYYITVSAVNQACKGLEMEVINFTQQCRPNVAPSNVQVMIDSMTRTITVTWDPVSLEDAQGFFMYLIIFEVVGPTVSSNGKQSNNPPDFSVVVSRDQTSYTVTSEDGYDPNVGYNVIMSLVVNDASGTPFPDAPTSPPQMLDPLVTPTPTPDDLSLIIIIICVVVVILLVAAAVLIIICVLVRKKSKKHGISLESNGRKKKGKRDLFDASSYEMSHHVTVRPLDEPPVLLQTAEEPALEPSEQQEDEEEIKKDLAAAAERRMDEEQLLERMKPISKISFHEHVAKMHLDSDKGYEEEYKSVPMETDAPSELGHLEMNKVKNRFANIFPYDFSRVRLKQIAGVPGSDYINACYVDGYNRSDCYIAAQGPLPTTVSDFWRIMWEQRITNIVMLTGVVEAGKKKCEQYWPDKVGDNLTTQSGLSVMLTSCVPFSDYTIRNLKVTMPHDETAPSLDLTHYHFTAWPDHGVPQFATSLISFLRRIQKAHDKDKGIPLVVHCSAGVGRTGTFIMLDTMMDRLKVEDTVNVYEFLRNMRSKRMHMVQTQVQYVFIHDALDELITCGETDILASNLRAKVNRMHKIVPSKNITGFQEQFQLLEQVCYKPNESAFGDALQPYNASKNRYEGKLPLNLNRPRLRPTGVSGSDYINASFVDGYKMRNAYITTQGPLKSTMNDFWRMVWEFKSRTIVMLCNTVEEGEEKCYMFWPTKENEPVEYGKLKVTLQAEIPGDEFITRKMHICNEQGTKVEKEGAVVTMFQYITWSEHSHPTSSAHMIELVETLTRAQMNTGNRPITVMCNDGIGRTGAFICIHSQLDRLKTDGDVDVFKYLKTARTRRQGLVIELDHYVYCHEVLADYVEAFDPYANFKNV